MSEERGPWYLATGLILGLALGLVYAWVLFPVRFIDNAPSAMREDFKDQYRALIAIAYAANGDIGRAQARLALLGDPDVFRALSAQAQQALSAGGAPNEARALSELAAAVRQAPVLPATAYPGPPSSTPDPGASTQTADLSPSPTLEETVGASQTAATAAEGTVQTPDPTRRPTRTPTPTRTPLPTRTPTATPGLPYVLQDRTQVCDPALPEALLQVVTLDADGNQVPGVELQVTWPAGEENFFTGLKPEIGIGYADFDMEPGVDYTLGIPEGGETVEGLSPEECSAESGERYWGGWLVIFEQP